MTRSLSALGADLLSILWPTACIACGAPDRDCCAACRAELRRPAAPLRLDLGGVPCFVRGPYDGALRALLVAYKHAGRVGFGGELGRLLREPLHRALDLCGGPRAPVVVTAPSRRAKVRERGFRHVEALVTAALRRQRAAVLRVPALRALRGRAGQVGLSAAERARNARLVAVRRSARRLLRGREVILVDDVVTTGATAMAARSALEDAGARVIAVVARCAVRRGDAKPPGGGGNRSGGGETRRPSRGGSPAEECSRVPERRDGAPHGPPA